MTPPRDPPSEPAGPHRGMIPRDELPFLPRVRWRFWAPILFLLVAFPAFWSAKRSREARRLRARLLTEHAALTASLAPEYRGVRSYIERATAGSVGAWEGPLRDPLLTFDALSAEPVLYGRVRTAEVHSTADVSASLRHRFPDQLGACLGVESVFARELLDKGAFLLPDFVDAVRAAPSAERLTALREDLLFRLRRDTEFVVGALRRRYLVLAVDEARASVDGPTRVYVFDLHAQRALLRSRDEGDGVRVIPFSIAGVTAHRPGVVPLTGASVSGHDCSVANGVRRSLGIEPMGKPHAQEPAPPPPDASVPSARDAAATDGGP